ncbi:hypothetical protein ACSBR2_041703 [Camellia fascicularis]
MLLTRGLTIIVLVSPSHLPLLQPILSSHLSSFIQSLVLPLSHFTSSQSGLLGKIRATGELYDPILQWFRSHPSPPVAIVSDFFLGWTYRLVTHLGVPRLAFWPSSAFTASILDSLWRDLPKNNDPVVSTHMHAKPYMHVESQRRWHRKTSTGSESLCWAYLQAFPFPSHCWHC